MEVLVAVLAALAVLLVPLAVLMVAGAIFGASGVVELATVRKRRTAAEGATPATRSAPILVARIAWWFVVLSGTLAAATVLLLLALNTFAFEWAVRRAFSAGERKSGIAATFESADGNLFVGRVNLRNAKFNRRRHPVSDFDLQVRELDVDANVWKLLAGQTVFEDVQVDGVNGQFTRNGKRDPAMPRRQFTIEELTVNNVSLAVVDHSRPPHEVSVPVEIESLQIAGFRSTWAAFDMLFRSTCRGLVDGQPFTVETRPIEDGAARETTWTARDLPVYALSGYFAGPLAWLVDGRLDVDVTTRWHPVDNDAELEMHCRFAAHGFTANVPDQLQLLQRIVEPTLETLNEANARLPMEFDVTMRKEAFRGQLSPLTAGLAEVLAQASGQLFPNLFPNASERISDRVEQLRSTIQELRRARAERRAAAEDRQDNSENGVFE